MPDGIIAHLTGKCGGNVHDRRLINLTSGSFQQATEGVNPNSGVFKNDPRYAAENAADLATDSVFLSAFRSATETIRHTRNNWVWYDFKERRIVPTHDVIRLYWSHLGGCHMKS
jgi:hypothetical protein